MSNKREPSLVEWTFFVLTIEGLFAVIYYWFIQANEAVGNFMLETTAAIMLVFSLIVLLKTSSYFPNWAAWGGLTLSLELLTSYYFVPNLMRDNIMVPAFALVLAIGAAFLLRAYPKVEAERAKRNAQELEETNRQMEQLLGEAGKAKQLDSATSLPFDEQLKPDKVKEQQ